MTANLVEHSAVTAIRIVVMPRIRSLVDDGSLSLSLANT